MREYSMTIDGRPVGGGPALDILNYGVGACSVKRGLRSVNVRYCPMTDEPTGHQAPTRWR